MSDPSYQFTTEGAVKKIKEWLNGDYERWFNGPSYHEATLEYILQLEAENAKLKETERRLKHINAELAWDVTEKEQLRAEAKKFKIISATLSMDFLCRLDYLKRGIESFMAEHGMEEPEHE